MEKEDNWLARSPVPLFAFLAFTLLWAIAALTVLGNALDIWSLPDWLSIPADEPEVRLGETGDFLTGWLQPLALAWFVITVFMQMRELRLQRQEFEKMREEYAENKEATQEQAKHLERANTLNNRTLVRSIIQDSVPLVHRNTDLSLQAVKRLLTVLKGPTLAVEPEIQAKMSSWLSILKSLRADNEYSGVSLDDIWSTRADPGPLCNHVCELIKRMGNQYLELKREAGAADMQGYYSAFCSDTIEGEITKVCWDLCEKMK